VHGHTIRKLRCGNPTGAGEALTNAIFSSSVSVFISSSLMVISGSNRYTAVATGLRASQRLRSYGGGVTWGWRLARSGHDR